MAILVIWNKKSKVIWVSSMILMLLLTVILWITFAEKKQPKQGSIFIEQSPYGEIRIVDKDEIRYLLIDGAIHFTVNPTLFMEPQHGHVVVMDSNKHFFECTGNMLLTGLGGGSIANRFTLDGWKVDAVEIDPVVTKVAREYFGLRTDDYQIFHADGRQFLSSSQNTYDLIIIDAFGSGSIPFHLITQQSFELIHDHLKPGGVFAINVKSVGWKSIIVKSVAATLKTNFIDIVALPLNESPNMLGNGIFVAANRKLDFPNEVLGNPADYIDVDPYEHWIVLQRNHAWDNRFVPDTKDIQILTDDRNPIEVWSEEINFIERKELHQFFGGQGSSW